jgi:hypothetical protein
MNWKAILKTVATIGAATVLTTAGETVDPNKKVNAEKAAAVIVAVAALFAEKPTKK